MSNIFKIIASDIKRLSVNVVAIVVIIGLSVIPSLYAWFNILSNWDPYGPDATKNLQVAVASSDEGMVIGGAELNVGDIIVSNLKENTTIGWVFTDTASEAINGVYAGDYYAALVIDESFSRNMVSFLGGNIENPKITYYENDKKNAIAPKITNKVKNTVKLEIDEAFISTLAKVLLKTSDYLVSVDQNGSLSDTANNKLLSLDSDIKGIILILDSYIALMDSTENLMVAGEAVSDQIDSLIESADTMADSAAVAASSMENVVEASADVMISGLYTILDGVDDAQKAADKIIDAVGDGSADIAITAEALEKTTKIQYEDWLKERKLLIDSSGNPKSESYKENISNIDSSYKKLLGETYIKKYGENPDKSIGLADGEIYALENSADKAAEDTKKVADSIGSDVQVCKSEINKIINEYSTSVKPELNTTISNVKDSLREVEKILKYKPTSIDAVVATLSTYPTNMDNSKESLLKARAEAQEMDDKLQTLINDFEEMQQNDQYAKVMELLENDPEFLAEFISSPVDISEEYIYQIDNNGSAASPFYIVLSIWVGSLIMSTILKTAVKDTTGLENVKNWQCFVGRYFVTWIIGQIQTLITVLGALLYVGIQCRHPFLLWLACSWTSTVFSLLLYSFTYSFGNLGEALSVILMVIQVAGAGGTFPVEVLPKVFQVLYKFMPFNYAMNALRECVGGFYEYNYWLYLLTLLIYVVVAVINGVLLYYPCKRLNEQIDKSKEKSGILI